jgi:serine/threonine protein kinase
MVAKVVGANISVMQRWEANVFTQELSLIWKFQTHKNVVKLYAWSDQPVALLLRNYTCGDLRRLLKHGSERLDYNKTNIISIMLQIASAVAFMHNEQVAHCDLKPANILLELDPQTFTIIAVLTDFGIARILDESAIKVEAFELPNTLGMSSTYASPEAIIRFRLALREDNPLLFKSSDAFSLGITLCEMLVRGDAWDIEHRKRYGRVIPSNASAVIMRDSQWSLSHERL